MCFAFYRCLNLQESPQEIFRRNDMTESSCFFESFKMLEEYLRIHFSGSFDFFGPQYTDRVLCRLTKRR